MNAEISETIKARMLGFGKQILEVLGQLKFPLEGSHAHCNAHTPLLKPV